VQINVSNRGAAAISGAVGTVGLEVARPGTLMEIAAWAQSVLPVMLA